MWVCGEKTILLLSAVVRMWRKPFKLFFYMFSIFAAEEFLFSKSLKMVQTS